MTPGRPAQRSTALVVVAVVAASLVLHAAQVGVLLGVRSWLDRRAYVTDLRLDAALETFRPVDRSGLARPVDPRTFAPERNPRAEPSACAPLTVLASVPPLDGQSWTGVNGTPRQPVTLLALRFVDAGAARAELDRKRVAMLRCAALGVTFPPYDAPATTYAVSRRHWPTSALGGTLRWSLVGGGKQFDFYVRRRGNVLVWTYADDVSTPQVRQEVADSLIARLDDLAHR